MLLMLISNGMCSACTRLLHCVLVRAHRFRGLYYVHVSAPDFLWYCHGILGWYLGFLVTLFEAKMIKLMLGTIVLSSFPSICSYDVLQSSLNMLSKLWKVY